MIKSHKILYDAFLINQEMAIQGSRIEINTIKAMKELMETQQLSEL